MSLMISWSKVEILLCIWYVHVTSVHACSWYGYWLLGFLWWNLWETFWTLSRFIHMNFKMFLGCSYELHNVTSSFLPFWQLYVVLNILLFFTVMNLMKFFIYSCWIYFKLRNERSFILTNMMILFLKSKRIFLYI